MVLFLFHQLEPWTSRSPPASATDFNSAEALDGQMKSSCSRAMTFTSILIGGIRLWDKVLLCCSNHSFTSRWVHAGQSHGHVNRECHHNRRRIRCTPYLQVGCPDTAAECCVCGWCVLRHSDSGSCTLKAVIWPIATDRRTNWPFGGKPKVAVAYWPLGTTASAAANSARACSRPGFTCSSCRNSAIASGSLPWAFKILPRWKW
jgi:hypothetical protein